MAVELRCPDCRAKLRLAEAPPAGDDIECPKCGNVFPAPEDEAPNRPARKRKPSEEDAPPPAKAKKPASEKPRPSADPAKASADKPAPKEGKKRKPRKKKANTSVLIGACIGGLVAVLVMVGVLFYLLSKQPPAVAMMSHVPGDATYAYGINFSQIQKYVKFYKDFEGLLTNEGETSFAGFEPITKALGEPFNELVDYSIGAGSHKWEHGDILILKTKVAFDPAKLATMGGKPDTIENVAIYTVQQQRRSTGKGGSFTGGFSAKIFAPTNRLIMMVPTETPTARIQQMLKPNSGDQSFVTKMGTIGPRIARGNVWWFSFDSYNINTLEIQKRINSRTDDPFILFGGAEVPEQKGLATSGGLGLGSIQGIGIRGNLRSKSISFEIVVQTSDSSQAKEISKRFNDSEIAKGDEGSPPQSFTNLLRGLFGDKLLTAQVSSNLNFSSTGNLFLIRAEAEVTKIKEKLPEWLGRIRGIQ